MATPTSLSCLRWNLTAKTTTRAATSTVKKAVTATRKKYSASTCAACSDACCGKNGKFVNIRLSTSRRLRRVVSLAAQADEQERQKRAHRHDEAGPDGVEHRRSVLPAFRVVVVAEEQHL